MASPVTSPISSLTYSPVRSPTAIYRKAKPVEFLLALVDTTYDSTKAAPVETDNFQRSSSQYGSTNEGLLYEFLDHEPASSGFRNWRNELTGDGPTSSLAISATYTITVTAGAFVFSMGAGTGTATFSGTAGATGTLAANSAKRTTKAFTLTAGTFIVTASVAALTDLQMQDKSGHTDTTTPDEYAARDTAAGVALVTDDFSNADGFNLDTGWTISGGTLIKSSGSGNARFATVNSVACVAGKSYLFEFDYTDNGSNVAAHAGGDSIAVPEGTGAKSMVLVAGSGSTLLGFRANDGNTGIIDNLVISEASTRSGRSIYGNGNTVDSGVVTEIQGAILRPQVTKQIATKQGNISTAEWAVYEPRQDSHVYALGEKMVLAIDTNIPNSATGNGHYYEVTTAGTSAASAPDFSSATSVDDTVVDGTVTWTNRGLYTIGGWLAEAGATNLCLHNRDQTNASWVKSTMTAALDQVGKDGKPNSASSLLATAANATSLQAFTIGSAVKDASFWLKRITGTGNIDITIDNGSTWTTKTLTTDWNRFDVSQILANPVIGIRIVTDTDKIAIDFAQLEATAFRTSEIETEITSESRESTNTWPQFPVGNIDDDHGSIIVDYVWGVNTAQMSTADEGLISSKSGTATNELYQDNNELKINDGTNSATVAASFVAGESVKVLSTWDVADGLAVRVFSNTMSAEGTDATYDGSFGPNGQIESFISNSHPVLVLNLVVTEGALSAAERAAEASFD